MSRNFELLTQLERESDVANRRPRPVTQGDVLKEAAAGTVGGVCGEEMLRLVQSVFLSTNGGSQRQVVFCGIDSESGSSSICASAGRVLAANSAQQVCLVDANVRSQRLSHMFEVDTATPFSGHFASLREQCVQIGGNLWLARADMLADASGSLHSADELKLLFASLRALFQFVLIDAPGAAVCGDAELLGQVADAAVLVIEANTTRRLTAHKAKESLEAAGVRLLGTVLHNRSFPIPEKLYKRI
jgi:receptor protein-tyrosine kinase